MKTLRRRVSTQRDELEGWLSQALVPVEPSGVFVRKLRGRLVHYRGERLIPPWAAFLTIAGILLVLLSWLSYFLRLVLALAAIWQLASRWKRKANSTGPTRGSEIIFR